MDNDHLSHFQDIPDLAFLGKGFPEFDSRIQGLGIRILVALLDELVKRIEIQAQVQIMDKRFLFVPDIHEGSIEGRHDLLHLAEIDIPHAVGVALAGLFVQFDQPVILHQGDTNLCRCNIDNQILLRFFRLHRIHCNGLSNKKSRPALPVSLSLLADC